MKNIYVQISFAVVGNGTKSNQFIETVEMSEELYYAFNLDQVQGGYNLANWIKNNLAYKVISAGYKLEEIVSPTISRSNREIPKEKVVKIDKQLDQNTLEIQDSQKSKVNYFTKIIGIILTIFTLVVIVEVVRGESPEVPMWFKIGLILVLMSITVSVNKSANGEV